MAEPSLGKCSHSLTRVILIPPAGVLLPVCAQHDSTGRCWDVLISCLKQAGPTADSCGKSDILTALIWNSFQWTGKAGVLLLMIQQVELIGGAESQQTCSFPHPFSGVLSRQEKRECWWKHTQAAVWAS